MAKELEIKFQAESVEQLKAVLAGDLAAEYVVSEWEEMPMETAYYDTPSGELSALRWTLRHRNEGGKGVACLKTPTDDPDARNEYEVEAEEMSQDALNRLLTVGAPAELLTRADLNVVKKICGARFTRRVAVIRLPDGTTANLSGDWGTLFGGNRTQPLCEIEVELAEGSEAAIKSFAALLSHSYGLTLQPKSKFARARALARECE